MAHPSKSTELPPLPSGYKETSNEELPPLPSGYVEKKKAIGNDLQTTSKVKQDGVLEAPSTISTTPKGSIDFEGSSLEAGNQPKEQEPIPTVFMVGDKLVKDNPLSLVQEYNNLKNEGTVSVGGGTGGAAGSFTQSPEAIKKQVEIKDILKSKGITDDGINTYNAILKDLPKEAQDLEIDGKKPYSFEELSKLDPIQLITKTNAVKTYFDIMGKKGISEANKFSRLQEHSQTENPLNDIADFERKKDEQKQIIKNNLSGEELDKALQRLEENSSIILNEAIPDGTTAEGYLANRLHQTDKPVIKNSLDLTGNTSFNGNVKDYSLETIQSTLDPNNKADQIAFSKYKRKVDLDEAINRTGSLDEAAIKFATKANEEVGGQKEMLNGSGVELPNAYKGEIVASFLSDPDVIKRAKTDPQFAEEYQKTVQNLYFNYPDYAKKEIAQKISQGREDNNQNNWFANVPTKEGTDQLVDKLVSEGKMTETEKLLYEKDIRPELGVWESIKRGAGRTVAGAVVDKSPIETPGLLESAQNSFNDTVHGIARSIEDLHGAANPASPLKMDEGKRLYQILNDKYSSAQVVPKSTLHEISQGTGNLVGFFVPMLAGGGLMNGVKGSEFITNALLFEGHNRDKALELFPKDAEKQYLYTGLSTAGDMMLTHLIPTGKVNEGLSKVFKNDIKSIVNDLADKKITETVAKQNLLEKAAKYFPELLKENTKIAGTMTGFNVFHNVVDNIFGANDMGVGDIANDAVKTFKTTFLTTPILAAMAVKGKNNQLNGKVLMEVSSNPEFFTKFIKEQSELHPELKAKEAEALTNLNDLASIKTDLDKTELTDKQKQEYLITAINKKIAERKASEISDPALKQKALAEVEKHDTDLLLLKAELGDKNYKDLTEEEKVKIELPKDHTVKSQPVKDPESSDHLPVIVNAKGEHELIREPFKTADEAKVRGEEILRKREFEAKIKNRKEEDTKLIEPLEGRDEQGVPIGEDVPAPTETKTDLEGAKELINSDVVKGYTADILKQDVNDADKLRSHLKDISEQAHDPESNPTTVKTYGKELVDIAQKMFPKEQQGKEVSGSEGERTDEQHASYIRDKFVQEFTKKGVPKEQVDAAVALMDARAKASGKGDTWYRQIEDIGKGNFKSGQVLYQIIDGIDLFKETSAAHAKAFIDRAFELVDNKDEAKSVYRKLASKYHADKNNSLDANEIMQYLNKIKEDYDKGKVIQTVNAERPATKKETDNKYAEKVAAFKESLTPVQKATAALARLFGNKSKIAKEFAESNKKSLDKLNAAKDNIERRYQQKRSEAIKSRLATGDASELIRATKERDLAISKAEKEHAEEIENNKISHDYLTGKIKFQDVKGAVETLANGRKIIHALDAPDFSTTVHEIAHVFEGEISNQERQIVQDWAGTKEWNTKTSETFARGFERYLRDGNAPTEALKLIFQKAKEWLQTIYEKIKGSPIEKRITPEVKGVFDNLFKEKQSSNTSGSEGWDKDVENSISDNDLKKALSKIGGGKITINGVDIPVKVEKNIYDKSEKDIYIGDNFEPMGGSSMTINKKTLIEDAVKEFKEKITDAYKNHIESNGKKRFTNDGLAKRIKEILKTNGVESSSETAGTGTVYIHADGIGEIRVSDHAKDAPGGDTPDIITGDKDFRSGLIDEAELTKAVEKLLGKPEKQSSNKKQPNEQAKYPLPKKSVTEMSSKELDEYADAVKIHLKKTKLSEEEEAKLTEEQKAEYYGKDLPEGGVYDPVEIQRISNRVSLIEEAETAAEIAATIKRPLIDYARKQDTENLAVISAAKRRAEELGISPEELLKESMNKIGSEFKDKSDQEKIVKEVLTSISKNEKTKEIENNKQAEAKVSDNEPASENIGATETGQGGKEPPKEPKVEEGKEDKPKDKKGVLNHLVEAKNIPEEAREAMRKEGLTYLPKSQKEAAEIAKSVLDSEGIDNAVVLARAQTFGGDVNVMIQTEALNRLKDMEDAAKTPQEKVEIAKKFAEVGIELDRWAREKAGRGISAIGYFYKKSPLGIEMIERAKRAEDFEQWSKPKDKSWKEFFNEMVKEPEFEAIVKEKVSEELKKERTASREARKKKVDDFFDKAKDQFKGGAAYSTIIPPKVITTALEGMRQAYHAGEAVVKVVQDAIDYISKELGHEAWDKDKFRNEWQDKLKESGGKKTLTDEELKIKILDKFRKKLKGLSDKERDEVIRKAFKQIVENGGLDYADFKKIIAEVTGRGELTDAEAKHLKELVKKTNSVDEAATKAREERSSESLVSFRKAQIEAGRAQRELSQLLDTKPDIARRLTGIMQLNTLGVPALVNNPIYNIVNQLGLRLPVGAINTVMDYGISGVSKLMGKNYQRETDIIASQAEFFKKLGLGTKESLEQFLTGLNRMDYTQKEVYGQNIRPFTSLVELYKSATGKIKLSKTQIVDKTLQGTVGIPAEIVARVLNLGDKPMRFGAEGAQASQFAKNLGLKGLDYKLFIEFPREEAYAQYKKQGLSDAEAGKKADYVKDIIEKEGARATFQQDNFLNDKLNQLFGGANSGVGGLAKSVLVSPYIKIPANAYWSYYNLVNPEVALLQSLWYGGKALAKRNKGDNSAAKDLHEARYWLAHAAVGIASRAVIATLVTNGIFTSANTEDDTKKEREGEQYYEQQGSINLGKLQAFLQGKDPNEVKDGLIVQNRWFGHWGTIGNAMARKFEEATPEQREKQEEFFTAAFGGMEKDALKDLEQGVFNNTSSLLTALNSPEGLKRYGINTMNMFANIIQPAAFAQKSRAELPYYTKAKADSFYDEVKNNFLTRSSLLRKLTGEYPPSKINIWGEPMKKKDEVGMRLFGISRDNKDNFAQPLYEDYKRTQNTKFFPPSVKPEINHTKLSTEKAAELETLVGQKRKQLIAPYINDAAVFEGTKKTYSQLSDEERIKSLDILYEVGYKAGKDEFLKLNPEFKIEPTRTEKKEKKKDRKENKKLRKAATSAAY